VFAANNIAAANVNHVIHSETLLSLSLIPLIHPLILVPTELGVIDQNNLQTKLLYHSIACLIYMNIRQKKSTLY
jgi:hypothetical protein